MRCLVRWSRDAVQGGGFLKDGGSQFLKIFLDSTVSRDVSYQKMLKTLSFITNHVFPSVVENIACCRFRHSLWSCLETDG